MNKERFAIPSEEISSDEDEQNLAAQIEKSIAESCFKIKSLENDSKKFAEALEKEKFDIPDADHEKQKELEKKFEEIRLQHAQEQKRLREQDYEKLTNAALYNPLPLREQSSFRRHEHGSRPDSLGRG